MEIILMKKGRINVLGKIVEGPLEVGCSDFFGAPMNIVM